MSRSRYSLIALLWVVFTDSLGSGLAFSVFTKLFFYSDFFHNEISNYTRNIIYEMLLGIYNFCMFIFAPIIGGLSDRYGRKSILTFSMLGLSIGFIFNALGCFYSNFYFLVCGRIISGLTAGSLSVAQASVIDISTPKNKSFYLSAIILANCLGFSSGPVLGYFFLENLYLRTGTMTFLFGLSMSLIGFLLISVYFKETSSLTDKSKLNILDEFVDIKTAFINLNTTRYLLSFLFFMLAYCLFFTNLPIYLHSLSLANYEVTGYILSSLVIALSVSTLTSGKCIFKRFEKKKIIIFLKLFQLIAYFIIALCLPSLNLNLIFFIIISACFGLIYIGLLTLISDITPHDLQGRVMGVIASISSFTWGVASLLSGWLNNFKTSSPLLGCAVFMIVSIIIFFKKDFTNKIIYGS